MLNQETARGGQIAPALLGVVLGTAAQLQQAQLWGWEAYLFLALCGFLSFSLPRWGRAGVGAALRSLTIFLSATLLVFSLTALRATAFLADALSPSIEGRDITVTGIVSAMPQRSDIGIRFRFDTESARVADQPVRIPPRILLGWYNDAQRASPELRAGERWQFNVRLKAPHGNSNPHGFDYELWLWEQGLQATGYVRTDPRDEPLRLAQTWRRPIELARQSVRDAILNHVQDRKAAGILAALVVGDQNAIERADWDIFRATGVAHLMSISGLHVTMFAWAASLAIGFAWRRSRRLCLRLPAQHAALAGGIVLATAYALFSGWGVPAQRTVWMLATVGILRFSGRRWPWPHVWLVACAVVVVIDPWALLQPGFWLSFVAVGVLFAAGPAASDSEPASRMQKGRAMLMSAWREQWIVTVALTPLTLLLFGQVSVVGLLANAFAIPWVTLVVTPLSLLGIALHRIWDAAAWAVQALAAWLELLAAFPLATVSLPTAPLWAGVAGVVGGLLLVMRLPAGIRLLGLPLLFPVLVWQGTRPAQGQFELMAVDIGQGNAVVVRTASHTLMYDAGPRYSAESDAGHRVIVPLLRARGERVDVLMLSHRDSDHTGGAAAVLAMHKHAMLHSSLEEGHELQALRPSRRCEAGQRWQWDGVDFEVMHPRAQDYESAVKPNAISCVLRVSNGASTALLAGDIEAAQEARLVRESMQGQLRADLLLVPHHGSKTSSTGDFLGAVAPSHAIVQAGYRNRYGHPAPVVMDRYRERAIAVTASPDCGAATWDSARAFTVACHRTGDPRYWRHRSAP
ncbi:DNA internalization-related competence protein ComEC/Rec2 [Caenimonas sp. SL110]|uniref:DNA internalization-related competence protein ComEC/Rec2 n=1 Tax=Caenimonas sp. SL110 TaxID=1450524 RepID=UPI000653428D|nr:DNA internalization-related competence protein ComEC/Rec2 [Caenimonas sp. SL110]